MNLKSTIVNIGLGLTLGLHLAFSVHAQEVVLAFDHTMAGSASLDGMARTKMLIKNMAKVNVNQAMFLIKTKDLSPRTFERLSYYDESGQFLVNYGHSYSIYMRAESYSYPIDAMKGDADLTGFTNYHQHIYFPYMTESGDEQKRSQLQTFFSEHNYAPVYITYRARDDYFDRLYQARVANNKPVDMRALENAYAKSIVDEVVRYDAKARLMLGFSPRQVILLHENDVAAYCIVALIDELNAKGFAIVAPEKVFSDPVANPYFVSGFGAVSYMPYLTGLPEPQRDEPYVPSKQDEERMNNYLRSQGLDSMLQ